MVDGTTCPSCGRILPAHGDFCPLAGTEPIPLGASDVVDPTRVSDPLLGSKLGDYLIRGRIGAGGMGVVYEGLEPRIGKRVAIKTLLAELARNPEERNRFLSEARAVNAVGHRGIVDIFAFGELPDGRDYLVMEYLNGVPLDARIAQGGPIPVAEVVSILDEVLAALSAAHAAGVIHRDLKPSNIFLATQPDGSTFVKLVDFGLAKMGSIAGATTGQTSVSTMVGTPNYIAPEQAQALPVGPRTDIYALGATAFEMLTGRPPFEHPVVVEVLHRHLTAPRPRPSQREPGIPLALDDLIVRMMDIDPEKRPASAGVVRQELSKIRAAGFAPDRAVTQRVNEASATLPSSSASRESLLRESVSRPRPRALIRALVPTTAIAATIALAVLTGRWWAHGEAHGAGQRVAVQESVSSMGPPAPAPITASTVPPPPAAIAASATPRPAPGASGASAVPATVKPRPPAAITPTPTPPALPKDVSNAQVKSEFSRKSLELKRCMKANRDRLPAEGFAVRFSIRSSGDVTEAAIVTPGLEAGPLADCITPVVKKMKFPKHVKPNVIIEQPLGYEN
jgi:serine/threonine protein kinase